MSQALPTLDASAEAAQVHAALAEAGGVILENFLAPPVVAAFNAELDVLLADQASREQGFVNEAVAQFFGDKVNHLTGLAGKSALFVEEVLCHPAYMAACDHFLKPNCADYQLNLAHLLQREPGGDAQILHRDAWVWRRIPSGFGEIQLASILALSDFTADNGATLVVPGSHKWDDERYPDASEAVPAEMRSGSAVIYLGNTYHAGGANVTENSSRRGMHISYAAGWLRTEENQVLATPIERVKGMPRRAQELLGFGVHDDIEIGGGYIGTVELEAPLARLSTSK